MDRDGVESEGIMPGTTFDPARQALAREYGRARRTLALAEILFGGVYLVAWALAPWAAQLRVLLTDVADRWRLPSGPAEAFILLGIALAFAAPAWFMTLPLDLFSSYYLPHRYGLSNQTWRGWVVDRLKGLLLGAALGGPMLLGLYALIRTAGKLWWLWASAGYAGLAVIMTTLTPVLVIPIFNRLRPLGDSHRDLSDRLTRLAETAGVRVRSVDTIDLSRRTNAANAMLVGLGRTRRIALGDTLLESFDPDEIETVLAHELGHHAHGDIPVGILIQSAAVGAVLFLESVVLEALVRSGHLMSAADPAGWPAFVLTWSLLAFVEAPGLHLYSRWREGRADDFALRLSCKPAAFIRAMIRLGDQNLAEADPPVWAVVLFGTHPSLGQRVAWARRARGEARVAGSDQGLPGGG
jgi:STE24 endopeptidase